MIVNCLVGQEYFLALLKLARPSKNLSAGTLHSTREAVKFFPACRQAGCPRSLTHSDRKKFFLPSLASIILDNPNCASGL